MGTPASSPEHLRQLSRLLGTPLADDRAAEKEVSGRCEELAAALFLEAVDSDDVTGEESALAYLEGRLAYFGVLITPAAGTVIRSAFSERLRAWG